MARSTTDQQLAKLPAYVRQDILQLERRVKALEAENRILAGDGRDLVIWHETGSHPAIRHGIPPGHQVTFALPNGQAVTCRLKEDYLQIYGSWSLQVEPEISNVIKIRVNR